MKNVKDLIKDGKEMLDKGEYKKALFTFLNVLKEHPDWPDIRNYLGLAYNFLNNLEEAEREFKEAIKLNPNYVEAHLNLALTYNEMGKYDLAEEQFEIASKLEKKQGNSGFGKKEKIIKLLLQLGDLYFETNDFNNALETYKKADNLTKKYPDIKLKIGRVYYEMKKYSNALIYFKKSIELNKNMEEAYFYAGLSYYNLKKYDDAEKFWNQLLKKFPENKKVIPYIKVLKDKKESK
ncbi:MAG: tetratricopeptide repeat protein [candidate division WOR-3 bacterium]